MIEEVEKKDEFEKDEPEGEIREVQEDLKDKLFVCIVGGKEPEAAAVFPGGRLSLPLGQLQEA